MSWSSLRVVGVCGLWLALQTGCGGNPEVSSVDPGTNGGSDTGGSSSKGGSDGNGGSFIIGGSQANGGNGNGGRPPAEFVCGNKELEFGEYCDDGNTDDDDGCSADCQEMDLDYDCSVVGEPCVKVVICGSGVLEGDEACDDGNTDDGDGCSADCSAVEAGYACVRPGTPCVEVAVCGNGVRERGEACDDGNPDAQDGCDDLCQVETGYFCSTPGALCVELVCGDGVRTPDEACDDGSAAADDGCDDTCEVRPGWRCNSSGCQPVCGDGLVEKGEACDDGDRDSGDGCSSGCTVEPYFSCTAPAHQISVCTSTIACGNSVVDPGEVCDPPGVNGCKAGCKSFNPTTIPAVCGNDQVEEGEGCEPPNVGMGCSAACQVEAGYTCPQPGYCFKNPSCGDGTVDTAQGEQCDPPAVGAGCSALCKTEAGYTCVGLGPSVCVKPVCGNGIVDPGEQCDDGTNTAAQDGCSACLLGDGFACPTPGAPCIPRCGDGKKRGNEECDDGNLVSTDGCNAGCKVLPGFKCPTPNMTCVATVCGDGTNDGTPDGTPDKGEGCDLGDKIAGDGCGPTCLNEPPVVVGPSPDVQVFCGDGLVTGTDECDDGNTTNGDGCSDACVVERPVGCDPLDDACGWVCDPQLTRPATFQMKITYRDFKSSNALGTGGHPDFQYNTFSQVRGITGNACNTTNQGTTDCGRLDVDGKPVLIRENQQNLATGNRPWDNMPYNTGTGIMNKDTFSLWYRDDNPLTVAFPMGIQGYHGRIVVQPLVKTITLTQDAVNPDKYAFTSGNFFPLNPAVGPAEGFGAIGPEIGTCNNGAGVMNQAGNCGGCNAQCQARNFGFTSEIRYFFQYKGGEQLIFTGDDDVWVYVNGRLAVDLGGLHSELSGQVVLGDDGNNVVAQDSNCSAHGVAVANLPNPGTPAVPGCYSTLERNDARDDRFDLDKGDVYEIVLFHAERHSTASNFRLTLQGFLAPRSFCSPTCGDGHVVGDEACDDGPNNDDDAPGACNTTCTARNYCGDNIQQVGAGPLSEACDDGSNVTLYRTVNTPVGACAPGCKNPAYCGDGATQAGQGEKCDKGTAQNTGAYGGCTATCQLGGYCGDGTPNGPEVCDHGALNGKEYGPTACGYDCKAGPHCGDAIPNGTEECDLGDGVNGAPGQACDATCMKVPGCGDGIKQMSEVCDYGQFYSDAYGGCTNMCVFGPHCGDGALQTPYEECDDGTGLNTGGYDGCDVDCNYGPRCGDAVLQAGEGEACDNGFNDDDYKFDDTSCGVGCTPPPSCGDGTVQASFELCDKGAENDDDAYDGCTTKCDFGPYCGDGVPQGPELCDNGTDNVSYAPEKGGCSYDCQPAPYCGDGTRNGPEQCDLGTDANTGEYGTCNPDCSFAPRCGDGIKQAGEQCDAGPSGSMTCSPTCKRRQIPA